MHVTVKRHPFLKPRANITQIRLGIDVAARASLEGADAVQSNFRKVFNSLHTAAVEMDVEQFPVSVQLVRHGFQVGLIPCPPHALSDQGVAGMLFTPDEYSEAVRNLYDEVAEVRDLTLSKDESFVEGIDR